ncbi:TPA: helix-turn-helix transcriptional regulator [Klebsiella pneumoniae]|nr:AlpA family transcriptional regulator [Klebsiella pneumoniae subsp. pneumoniae]
MNTTDTTNQSLIRLSEVLKRTGFGKAWIYRLIKDDKFPAPVKIGTRAVAFVESEIDALIQSVIETSRNNVA